MDSPLTMALKKLARSVKLPTDLSSAELMKIRSGLRERAVFSARVVNAEFLDRIQSVTKGVASGQIRQADATRMLKSWLRADRYEPPPGEEGRITDLTSNQRLRLIVRTNVGMAQGYAQHVRAQSEIEDRPWQEMYRRFQRVEPRDWVRRWRAAGGRLSGGRMMAPVNDPIWTRLSAFGLPYPPFDFNSGMWTRTLTVRQAKRKPPEQQRKRFADFNARLKSDVLVESRYLKRQLMEDLGPEYKVDGGVVTRRDD